MKKLESSFALLFIGNAFFDGGDGFYAYLIFQPIHRYFKIIINTKYVSEWKSKVLSDESIEPTATSNNSLTPLIGYVGYTIRLKFYGRC